jgi:NADPH2:quinone reductase
VVYDSIGKDTFLASLDCLKPLGLMVSFGNASGKVAPFDIGILSQKGSLYLTRPTLATYTATRADLAATASEMFEVIRNGTVKVEIRHAYPLAQAAQVHRDLESRRTIGSIVMIP